MNADHDERSALAAGHQPPRPLGTRSQVSAPEHSVNQSARVCCNHCQEQPVYTYNKTYAAHSHGTTQRWPWDSQEERPPIGSPFECDAQGDPRADPNQGVPHTRPQDQDGPSARGLASLGGHFGDQSKSSIGSFAGPPPRCIQTNLASGRRPTSGTHQSGPSRTSQQRNHLRACRQLQVEMCHQWTDVARTDLSSAYGTHGRP